VRRVHLMTAVLVSLAVVVVLGAASPRATAAAPLPPWEEGTAGHPFTLAPPIPSAIEVLGGDDQRLQLARLPLTVLDPSAPMWSDYPAGKRPDPRMVYPLAHGHLLISGGREVAYVKEVDASGNVVWAYRNGADGLLRNPFSAELATFGGKRCVLISDRIARRVFAVTWDAAKRIVWQYGTTDVPGQGVNQLRDPFCATQIAPTAGQTDGNVLIADSNDNHRVIEVRADDYVASAATMGYDAASIVWQYGVTGQGGSAPGYLNQARSPQRLPNGDTLITDAAGQRVIEVRTSDYDASKPANGYTAASIRWSYVGGVDGTLQDPNTARYVTSGALAGTVLISDGGQDTQWVRLVDYKTKQVDETFDLKTYDRPGYVDSTDAADPRDARADDKGALWIADAGFGRILQIGNQGTGTVTSQALDCGKPGLVKAFVRLKTEAPAQAAGTGLSIWYSLDGSGFERLRASSDGRDFTFPAGVSGSTLIYRLTLTSKDRWTTPVFEGMTIHFEKATTGGGPKPGGRHKPGGGSSGGSGVYKYPATAAGGTGTYGTGTGSGGSGTGMGSGSSGSGAGRVGTGSGSSSMTQSLQPPVQSSGSGQAQSVQGYLTQGAQGVSGVPLRAAEGPQAPSPESPGSSVPVLALLGAGLVIAAAFFVPWPFAAARIRAVAGFDHTRPKYYRPFWPLGK
jgi:hypothetical protein